MMRSSVNSRLTAYGRGRLRSALCHQLLQVAIPNERHFVVAERLLELGARQHVEVALTPRRPVRLVIHRDRLELGVIVAEVDDDLGEPRLEPGNGVEVELLPA